MLETCSVDIVDKYICFLNEYRTREDLSDAKHVYYYMCRQGLDTHPALENYLVPLFVKCGSLPYAQQIFNKLLCPNEHSWTSLISGYVGGGQLQHAFNLYVEMPVSSLHSLRSTALCLLKACNQSSSIHIGRKVHVHIAEEGYDNDILIASSLMDMYSSAGFLTEAQAMFDDFLDRDIGMWNVLIAGYTEHGLNEEALLCVDKLESEGLSSSDVTIVSALRACSAIRDLNKCSEIFSEAVKKGFDGNYFIGNTAVDMFASLGLVEEAQYVFHKLPVKDLVTWNALISGYAEYGFSLEALDCFQCLQSESCLQPDNITFYCCLKACGNIRAIKWGQKLHTETIEQGLEVSAHIGSALIYMYAKFGWLEEARKVFDSLQNRDLASWNTLIAGYAEHGANEEAIFSLELMHSEGSVPDPRTFTHCLKACSNIGFLEKGQSIHAYVVARGMETDPFLGNTLLDMYGEFGHLAEMQDVFDKMAARDAISWNVMITAFAENGLGYEALDYCEQMPFCPNSATFISKLKACSVTGMIGTGQEVHSEIVKKGNLSYSSAECAYISTALVDMYGKCGSMIDAQGVFDDMPTWYLATCNALLSGYTCQGENELVLELFERMKNEGIQPDDVTYLCVLNACCRTGLLCQGREYFEAMSKEHAIIPTIKHYNCMVDLLSRAGRIKEAVSVIENMPFQPDQVTWNIVLTSCQNWGNVELGKQAFECTMTLDNIDWSAFVLMSNICTENFNWRQKDKI